MKPSVLRFIICIIIAGLIGYYFGVNKVAIQWNNFSFHVAVTGKEPPTSLTNADFSLMWVVLKKLQDGYYDKKAIDGQKLVNGAISGMVNSLDDPYTVYLPPKQNDDFKQVMAGEFDGIGAELGMKDKNIVIVAPLDGSPAEQAGVKQGDLILKVDGQTTQGWTLNQAVDKIRGPKGTQVALSLQHADNQQTVDVKITRNTINVKSVTSWVKQVKDIDGIAKNEIANNLQTAKIAYIRLSEFGDKSKDEWSQAVSKISFQLSQDKSIRGMILDLRNNPGGRLDDAVYIASDFIKSGAVVIQENGDGTRENLDVSGKGLLTNVRLIVLINKGSASASEIVSGALRDHNRAALVGETSFGKGTVQTAEDLGNGAGLHITTAKWLTPNGIWVHKKGLTPDISVSVDSKDPSHDKQLEKAIGELVK